MEERDAKARALWAIQVEAGRLARAKERVDEHRKELKYMMFSARQEGITLSDIARAAGVSKQWVHEQMTGMFADVAP